MDSDRGLVSTYCSWITSEISRGLGLGVDNEAWNRPSSSSVQNTIFNSETWLNDSIYQLHKPAGKPSMQVLFFHGLQFGDYKNAHLSTWESADGSDIWPQIWLVEKFPDAHVLSVSYDARVPKGDLDLHNIGENLTSDLAGADIGQEPHCPVILVGHCFGGIVIKQLCLHAHIRVSLKGKSSEIKLNKFLQNVKGIFYYSTPHHGIPLEIAAHFVEGPLLNFVEILSTDAARLNSQFDTLGQRRYQNAWRIAGVGESLSTKWGRFEGVVVPEASARVGDFNVVEKADHISICKPKDRNSRSFSALTDLIDAIVLKLDLKVHKCQGLPEYPVGLEGRAAEIRENLKIHRVVGIVGMGGIGKTVLAKEVFNRISREFECTCFVDNVKGLENLADWIQRNFYCNGRIHRGRMEWAALKGKKMLIVMDDVDTKVQLEVLPILNHFGSGSRVIITTRDQKVLEVYDRNVLKVYEVNFLKDDEAHELLYEHAFGHQGIPDSLLRRQAQTVLKKCNGLPLALEVIGRHLRGHEIDARFWEGTIRRLGEARASNKDPDDIDRVWASLKVSYDALEREDKEMFASAATFFFDWPLERALAAWSTTCGKSGTGWANLVSRCLVKEVSKTEYNFEVHEYVTFKVVWVHEHLRYMAKIVAPSNMEYASGGESAQSLVERLNAKQVKAETEFLKISSPTQERETRGTLCCGLTKLWTLLSGENKPRTLLFRSLLNVLQLKYIELEGVLLKGSPKKFPRQLSLLRWVGATKELKMFPVSCIEEMENLAVLQLENWKTSKAFPKALEKLTKLSILHLKQMKAVDPLVDLLPKDLGKLSQLKHLELVNLTVSKLPEDLGILSQLKHLELVKLSISKLPESFGCLKSLVKLRLLDCEKLEVLPKNFELLCSLEELKIRANHLEMLPENLGKLTSLKKLDLHVNRMKALPESVGQLSSMRQLRFYSAAGETLPDSLGQLASLQTLHIDCDNVRKLPDRLGQLASLQELTIRCPNVKKLPAGLEQLVSLQQLEINCRNVMELPDKLGQLASMTQLSIDCRNMKVLPDSLGQLAALEKFCIRASLTPFPKCLEKLHSLKSLEIWWGEFESLPESLGHLSSLQTLEIWHCRNLKSLPDSLGRLSSSEITKDTQRSNRLSNALRGIRLFDSPLLDDSMLQGLGWCTTNDPRGKMRWYVRKSI